MKKLLVLVLGVILLTGCATSIKKVSADYLESSVAVKEFATISAQDWLFGSGIIRGALDEKAVPAWVFEELDKVDAWFEQEDTLTDLQLGYMVGVRLRLAGPIIKSALEQYAPGIFRIVEVGTVLAFLGL